MAPKALQRALFDMIGIPINAAAISALLLAQL